MLLPSKKSSVDVRVSILDYSDFHAFMVDPTTPDELFEEFCDILKSYDCLVGIPDYSMDYL